MGMKALLGFSAHGAHFVSVDASSLLIRIDSVEGRSEFNETG